MSDFGKGTAYCLGLFLCHAERQLMSQEDEEAMDKRVGHEMSTELWFNAASDHLYELKIPENYPEKLKVRLTLFKHKVIRWGHGFKQDAKREDRLWAINEATELLRLIDEHQGIKTTEAQWK